MSSHPSSARLTHRQISNSGGTELRLAQSAATALVFGLILGLVGRQLLRSRVRLTVAEATLCGIVGAIIGGGVAGLIMGRPDDPDPVATGIGAFIGTILVLLVVDRYAWFKRRPSASAGELIAAGESAQVEFKSSARYNLHSKQRDERIELVIAKTVAAFANSDGGVLLIGVNDDGEAVGLDKDLQFMKQPDLDRFELWLRDWLGTTIGLVATTNVQVEFEKVDGLDVCVVRVPAATRPVIVSAGKEKKRALFVRAGNSTRELQVDEALAYSASRWRGRSLRKALR